jgi:hypothetical protein
MRDRVFVDTNLWIYLYSDSKKHEPVQGLLDRHFDRRMDCNNGYLPTHDRPGGPDERPDKRDLMSGGEAALRSTSFDDRPLRGLEEHFVRRLHDLRFTHHASRFTGRSSSKGVHHRHCIESARRS